MNKEFKMGDIVSVKWGLTEVCAEIIGLNDGGWAYVQLDNDNKDRMWLLKSDIEPQPIRLGIENIFPTN
mgnify:CR=1 FL=1